MQHSYATVEALAVRLECGRLDEKDAAAWDRYVHEHPQGSPFHLMAWERTIEQSFPYRPHYILVKQNGLIQGVLPIFLVSNPIIGRALISTPFAVYGGVLASSEAASRLLHEFATELGKELAVDYIDLRNAFPEQCTGEPNVFRYATFSQALEPVDSDEGLLATLPKKTRNLVRKSMKTPFSVQYGVRDTAIMHRVHSRNMRRLGTPNFPPKYFRNLLANFGALADIRHVLLDGQPAAVSLNLYFKGEMHTYHAAADNRLNALAPNMFMYFDHLRWASRNGFRTFDFGRSKLGTGSFDFKKHWNTTMRPLPYQVVLVKRKTLPNFSPTNPRIAAFTKIWPRLPLPVTRAISPLVFPLFP